MTLPLKNIMLILPLCFAFNLFNGQVEVDRHIEFTNPDDSLRNIDFTGNPTDKSSGVSIKSSVHSPISFIEDVSFDVNRINLNVSYANFSLLEGTLFEFICPTDNTNAVEISINNQSYFPLVAPDLTELPSGEIKQGDIIRMVFDGNKFQLLNKIGDSSCPSGDYLAVDNKFCIERNTHPEMSWHDAVKYCMDRGARLCSWDEFGRACDILNDGTNDFTDYWEWVNTKGDHSYGARVVGRNGCQEGTSQNAELTPARFRCCADK